MPELQDMLDHLEKELGPAHAGKVRNSYKLPHTHWGKNTRLYIATDRISIFDFVLGFEIPQKGEVLAAINFFWREHLKTRFLFLEHDLIAGGRTIDLFLPEPLRGWRKLWKRSVVVEELPMIPVEVVLRMYLLGSAWAEYKATGKVWGHPLRPGLKEGSKLGEPLFTPTTKAPVGQHDMPLDPADVEKQYGEDLQKWGKLIFEALYEKALEKGLILADTKFEFGYRLENKQVKIVLADEVGTPDSSRYWKERQYERSYPSLPPSLDKQFVREWGKKVGLSDPDRFDPSNPEDRQKVKKLVPPQSLIHDTRSIYMESVKMLTGLTLEEYQKEAMGIR